MALGDHAGFHVGLRSTCPWSGTWPRRCEAASVSGNLRAYIKLSDRAGEALGDRKQSAGLYCTKGTAQLGGARPCRGAGSPRMALMAESLAARG